MTWHTDRRLLDGYTNGRLGRAQASSVEAHLMGCADCHAGTGAARRHRPARPEPVAIVASVDQPVRHWPERLLVGCGVSGPARQAGRDRSA